MAGATLYPGGLDNFAESSPTNLGDNDSTGRTHAERHDDIESAMEAVQGELGTNPSGAYNTVAQRLAAIDGDADFVTLESSGTAVVPLTVIGTASQASDLMQFKNSGGTAIASVSAAGAAIFAGVESTGFTVGGTSIFNSSALIGTPTAPTASVNTNTTQIATTAFVLAQAGTATPIVEGSATAGTATRFAREDHVHPSDGGGGGTGGSLPDVFMLMGA